MIILVPLALLLGFGGLIAFLWTLKNGQYDDLDGAAWRAIADDDEPLDEVADPAAPNQGAPGEGAPGQGTRSD